MFGKIIFYDFINLWKFEEEEKAERREGTSRIPIKCYWTPKMDNELDDAAIIINNDFQLVEMSP